MVQKIVETLTCDLEGQEGCMVEGAETITFAYLNEVYEMELCVPCRYRLKLSLSQFIEFAVRKSAPILSSYMHGRGTKPSRDMQSRRRSAKIRAWAKQQGIPLAERGRIPDKVVMRWERETQPHLRRPAHNASAGRGL